MGVLVGAAVGVAGDAVGASVGWSALPQAISVSATAQAKITNTRIDTGVEYRAERLTIIVSLFLA